jgi:hypothetical protein
LAFLRFQHRNSPGQAVFNRGLSFGFLSFVLSASRDPASGRTIAGGSLLNR